ncbi:MAG: hypothetical protein M1815_001243 [Lichina confinis]|nr:MAG: hypothetical protein M1815_001243 [Lichina confinis]
MHLSLLSHAVWVLGAIVGVNADDGYDRGQRWRTQCAGTPFTTIGLSTIPTVITSLVTTYDVVTVPTTTTFPYSCYTQLIPTLQSDNSFCGTFTGSCPSAPACTSTETFTQPCKVCYARLM